MSGALDGRPARYTPRYKSAETANLQIAYETLYLSRTRP